MCILHVTVGATADMTTADGNGRTASSKPKPSGFDRRID
jgi:hypothetical protein